MASWWWLRHSSGFWLVSLDVSCLGSSHLLVDRFHGDLEPVEAARLGELHLLAEPLHLIANAKKTHLS